MEVGMELNPIELILDVVIRIAAVMLLATVIVLIMAVYAPTEHPWLPEFLLRVGVVEIVVIILCFLSRRILRNIH
jgi:hypothetical protein